MFDLFRSRDKAVRYLLGALLVLVALSMLTYLVPGGYSSGAGARDEIVAQVGKEKLTVKDVQLQLQSAMRNKSFPAEMAEFYVPQYIDKMITDRALAYEAERLGLKVTDSDVAETIRTMLPQLFMDGKFDKNMYQGFLAQQNMTIPEFEENVKKQMLLTNLRNIVLEGIVVTDQEVQQEFRRRNDKVKLEYIAISPAKFKSTVTVTPQELMTFYNTNRGQFMVPEKRNFDGVVFDDAKIGAAINIPEGALRAAYQANQDRFRTPERVHVRHILIKTLGKSKDEVPKLQAKAEALQKQLKAGANFEELAKKNSEDPGSGAKGGDLGWVEHGQMVKPFEDASFSLKPHEISNVITTEYGFHILEVLEHEQAHLKPFDEVKNDLANDLKKQQVFERMQQYAEQARTELSKNPGAAEQIAQQLNGTAFKVDKAGAGDPIPEIGVNKDFEAAVASTPKGGVTPVMQLAANKLAVVAVTDVFPAHPAEFAEVESKIRDAYIGQRAQTAASVAGQEAVKTLESNGGDLQALAKKTGLEVKTTGEFNRDGAAEGIGSADYVADAFAKPVGSIIGPVTISDTVFVAKTVQKLPADMSKLAEQRGDLITNLKRKKSNERNELFEDGVVARLIKEGKVKKNDAIIKQIMSSYRAS